MASLDGDGQSAMASAVERSWRSAARATHLGFSQGRLGRSPALLLVAVAVIMFAMTCVSLDVFGAATQGAADNPLRVGNAVPAVSSEGFHARAMAAVTTHRDRAFAAEEPAGFVFEAANAERGETSRAAALLAAAGPPVLVLDGADDVKDTIRRCTENEGCDSANIIPEIRARVAELMRKGLAQPPASPVAEGYGMCSRVSAKAVGAQGGVETHDEHLSWWTSGGDSELQREWGVVKERLGGLDTEQRSGAVDVASCHFTAANPREEIEDNGERLMREEVYRCGTRRTEDTSEYPERGGAWCGTNGWGAGAGAEFARFQEVGMLGVTGGGVEAEGLAIGQTLSPGSGRKNGTIALAVTFALTGWKMEETEALLQAYAGTPWLYLYGDQDGRANSCPQNLPTVVTAARIVSRTAESAKSVVLPSSSLTPASAARVLTRLFGVELKPEGELLMAELYANRTMADAESSLDVAGDTATVSGAGAPWNVSSPENSARPAEEACRVLREAAMNSAKVLGGPFDSSWWWDMAGEMEGEIVSHGHRLEQQEVESCRGGGIVDAPACSGSSTAVLAANADVGDHDAGAGTGHGWRCRGAGDGGGDAGASRSGRLQDEAFDGGGVDGFPPGAVAAAASAAAPARAGAERAQDTLELGALASPQGGEVGGEGAWPLWHWQRGMRRMVDRDSPLWMSSEVYSEPVESFPCPDVPGPNYPPEWPLLDLLGNWNPGNASAVPPRHFLGVCRFDYQTELHKARAYGIREVPFVVYNVPELDRAVQDWSNPIKLGAALEDHLYSIDVSSTNRFLYYGRGKRTLDRPPGWTPPTWRITGTFDSWLRCALGAACDHIGQPPAEHDLSEEQHTDPSGMFSDQPLDQCPMMEPIDPDQGIASSEASGAQVGRDTAEGRSMGVSPPGSRLHYYLKLSSTVETPNRFIDRSLPFFVPPASSRRVGDDGHHVRPADGDYTAGKKGRRRKSSKKNSSADKESSIEHRGGRLEEPVDGDAKETAGWNRGSKRQKHSNEETDSVESMDIFLRDASATRGIHCRLGMDGVMSEGHYDGSRNMVTLLAGKRRWILSSPKNCADMHMFRRGHPSARHTSADWTDPDVAKQSPDLEKATANEVILRAGEALYVPEHWIHSIVNIGVSAQCNSRSGKSYLYQSIVRECEASASAE